MAGRKQTAGKKALARAPQAPDFVAELSLLGRRIEGVLKAAVNSKEARGIQNEVAKSIKTVGKKLSDAVEAARKSEETRGLREQAKNVIRAGRSQGLETAKQAQANLSSGLKGLSRELEKIAQNIRKTRT